MVLPIDNSIAHVNKVSLWLAWLILCRYVTSHLGQLSLYPQLDGTLSTGQEAVAVLFSWKGSCRFGFALAMCHRHSDISTYRPGGLRNVDERLFPFLSCAGSRA